MLANTLSSICKIIRTDPQEVNLNSLSPDTYRVCITHRPEQYKLRIQNDSNNRPSLMRNEAAALRFLEAQSLEILHPRLISIDEQDNGNLFSIQSYLDGEVVSELRSEVDRRKYYTIFSRYIDQLHSVPGTFCGRFVKQCNISWSDNFTEHFGSDFNEAFSILPKSIAIEMQEQITNMIPFMVATPRLLHGDPHPANMIFKGLLCGMLDYQHCLFGDPLFETAQFYVRITRYDTDPMLALKAFISGKTLTTLQERLLNAYILALFINEIAFAHRIGKIPRIVFYKNQLLDYWNMSKI